MTQSRLRLENADLRVRVAALEARLERAEGVLERVVNLVGQSVAARALRLAHRHDREKAGRYDDIREVAQYVEPDNTEATARRIRRLFKPGAVLPEGAAGVVARLRYSYPNGPSKPTIRRALSMLSACCENGGAPEQWADFHRYD